MNSGSSQASDSGIKNKLPHGQINSRSSQASDSVIKNSSNMGFHPYFCLLIPFYHPSVGETNHMLYICKYVFVKKKIKKKINKKINKKKIWYKTYKKKKVSLYVNRVK